MNGELEKIVQKMIDAGESEDNIALVIKEYSTVKKKDGTTEGGTSAMETGVSGLQEPPTEFQWSSQTPETINVLESGGGKTTTLRQGEYAKPVTDISSWQAVTNAFERGKTQGYIADELTAGKPLDQIDWDNVAALNKKQYAPSAAYKKYNESTTVGETLNSWLADPIGITSQIVTESMTALGVHGATKILERGMEGALTGAATGTVMAPGAGTVTGWGLGWTTGATYGMGEASLNLEYSGSILESLQEVGVDITNAESMKSFAENEDKMIEFRDKALKKGVTIALVDMFTARVASKILQKPAKDILGSIGKKLAAGGVEAAGGMGGEAGSQVLTEGDIKSWPAIFSEGWGELATTIPDATILNLAEKSNKGTITAKDVVEANKTVSQEKIDVVANFTDGAGITNNLKNDIEIVRNAEKKVPEVPQRDDVVAKVAEKDKLKQQQETLDDAFKEDIEQEVKSRDVEIKMLRDNIPSGAIEEANKIRVAKRNPTPKELQSIQDKYGLSNQQISSIRQYLETDVISSLSKDEQQAINDSQVISALNEEGVDAAKALLQEKHLLDPAQTDNVINVIKPEENDTQDQAGVSGGEREGQTTEQAKPNEGASTQEAETGRILQIKEKVKEKNPLFTDEEAEDVAMIVEDINPTEEEVDGVIDRVMSGEFESQYQPPTEEELAQIESLPEEGEKTEVQDEAQEAETTEAEVLIEEYGKAKQEEAVQQEALASGEIGTAQENAIARNLSKVSAESFARFGDRNTVTPEMKRAYFAPEGETNKTPYAIDGIAKAISESEGVEVTPQDIVDFINAYPNGIGNPKSTSENTFYGANQPEYRSAEIADQYKKLTGKDISEVSGGVKPNDPMQRVAEGIEEWATAIGIIRLAEGAKRPDAVKALQKIGQGLIDAGIATVDNAIEKIKEYIKNKYGAEYTGKVDEIATEIKSRLRPKKKTPVQRQLEKVAGVKKPVKEVTVNERTALKNQIRLEAKAAKEGFKSGKAIQQSSVEAVTSLINDALKKDFISDRTFKSMMNRLGKAKTPLQFDRLMTYIENAIDDATYVEAMQEVSSLQKKAKKMSKDPKMPINHKQVLEGIKNIEADLIKNVSEFRDKANEYMQSFLPVGSKNYKPADTNEMLDYLDRLQEEAQEAYDKSLKDSYGVEAEGISAKELMDAMESEDIDAFAENLSEAKQKALSDALTKLADYSKLGLDTVSEEGLSTKEKSILKSLKEIDPTQLSNKQKVEFIKTADNVTVNNKFYGAEKTATLSDAIKGMKEALSGAKGVKVREMVSWGKFRLAEEIYSVSDMFRRMFGIGDAMAKVQAAGGFTKLMMGNRSFIKDMTSIQDKVDRFFSSIKDKNRDSAENRAAEGIVAYLLQPVPNETPENSFAIRMEIVKQDLEVKRGYKDTAQEAALIQDILAKIDGASIEEVMGKLKTAYPTAAKAIDFYKDSLLPSYKDQIQENSELFFNTYSDWNNQNYLPISYKGRPNVEIELDKSGNPKKDVAVKPKEAPNTIKRTAYKNLPQNQILDYNLRGNVYRNLLKDMYNVHTAAAWQQIKDFMELPQAETLFGGKENVSFVNKKMQQVMDAQLRSGVEGDVLGNFVQKATNKVRQYAVGFALGGFTQAPKQMSEQVISALVNNNFRADILGKNMVNIGSAKGLLDKFGIGGRGQIKGGTTYESAIEAGSSKISKYMSSNQFKKAAGVMEQISDLWLKALQTGDEIAAKAAWMTFYERKLNEKGIQIQDWAKEGDLVDSDPNRLEAATYAETMTDITQVSSDATKLAKVSQKGKSGYENFFKAVFLPFSTFSIQMRSRLINDTRDVLSGRNPKEAGRSLAGTVLGVSAFQAMNVLVLSAMKEGMVDMLLWAFDIDDDKSEEEKKAELAFKWKKMYSNLIKDVSVSGFGQMVENGYLDAMNAAAYWILSAMDDESVMKNDELMDFTKWRQDPERTPFYRYGQWQDNDFSLGLYEVLLDRPLELTKQGELFIDMEKLTDEQKGIVILATATETLYNVRMMDTDVYRMVKQSQKIALDKSYYGVSDEKVRGLLFENEISVDKPTKPKGMSDEEFNKYANKRADFIQKEILQDYDRLSKLSKEELKKEVSKIKSKATDKSK